MFGREESFPPQPATARTATSATATRSGGRLRKKACIGRPGRSLIPGAEESYHDLSDHQREGIFAWCEANGVHYVTGIARNTRLEKLLKPALERVEDECAETGGVIASLRGALLPDAQDGESGARWVEVAGYGHNDLLGSPEVWRALEAFLESR